jgi:hypothetical protein
MAFEKLSKVLTSFGENIVEEYKKRLSKGLPDKNGNVRPTSTASGRLYNSIDYRVDIDMDTGYSTLHFIANDYWINIENGRVAGTYPNIGAIENWIKSKRISDIKGIGIKRQAFLISKSIKEKGIRKKPFLKNTLNAIYNKYKDMIQEALNEDLKIEISVKIAEGVSKINNKSTKMLKITHKKNARIE